MSWNLLRPEPAFTLALAALLAPTLVARQTDLDFAERFALATDRRAVLRELIPGSEEAYYYECLERQHAGAFGEVPALLERWITRHGRDARVAEIENRQALLTFDQDAGATFDFLRRRLDVRFDAQRELPGASPDLPTRLDPGLISRAAFTVHALLEHPESVDGVRASGLPSLLSAELDDALLMSLLQRLDRPDVQNLPAQIVRNLDDDLSRGFGSLPIHDLLLLEQLDECAQLRPSLLGEWRFVAAWLRRLRPAADGDWRQHAELEAAYLDRLEAFCNRLTPAFNSLKAHVLGNRLRHDLAHGRVDRQRLGAFLRLPCKAAYVNAEWLERRDRTEPLVDPKNRFETGFDAIGDPEALVCECLMEVFRTEDSYAAYTDHVSEAWLRRCFAEAKILAGDGDAERWYSMLDDPAYYEELKDRVEIRFPATRTVLFGARDPIGLDVDIKHVTHLVVKVFEIDTLTYYRDRHEEVSAWIDLDGLVAAEEYTFIYDESPLRRVRRHFEFPSLTRPGVYVVEFIGNGVAGRAVIRKGKLQLQQHLGAAGHVLRVQDDDGQLLRDATVIFGGREYIADERGELVIPYTNDPGSRPIILRQGDRATLASLDLQAEEYTLDAGVFVEREALVAGRDATLMVRPRLLLNGVPMPLALLREPSLRIDARDAAGVASQLVVKDLDLRADREFAHAFRVPEGMASLAVELHASVRSLTEDADVALHSQAHEFAVNAIDRTSRTFCPLLGRTTAGYVLDVRGRNGEPRSDLPVRLQFEHRDFVEPVIVQLKTDAHGRIHLGELDGIAAVQASGLPDGYGAWPLLREARTWPQRIQGLAGETLRVPLPAGEATDVRAIASLLEVRDGVFVHDRLDRVAVADGYLELRDLPPGDHDLWLKGPDRHIDVRVTAGVERDGLAIGRDRMLERGGSSSMHLTEVRVDGDDLMLRLAQAQGDARVHVFRTRYLPTFDPFAALLVSRAPPPSAVAFARPSSSYRSDRVLDDEYRYILERRFATRYPGNMLERPSLLLNPWAVDERVSWGPGGAAPGAGRGAGGGKDGGGSASKESPTRPGAAPGTFADLAFLPDGPGLIVNLRPDANGLVRVPLRDLGSGALVHALAIDGDSVVYRSLAVAETPWSPRDLRLVAQLDPTHHQRQARRIERIDTGTTAIVEDASAARVEGYDSLGAVYRLYLALTGDADLARFAFVLRWPQLDAAEKRRLYAENACHELHFFLHRKDPQFFAQVVRPYLANKMDKTFLDHYLLDDDLAGYLEPWSFARQNAIEQILLCRRIAGEAEAGARFMRERLASRPLAHEREVLLIEAALRSGLLDALGGLGARIAAASTTVGSRTVVPPGPASRTAIEEGWQGSDADRIELERRVAIRSYYRAVGPTRVYAEQNYWRRILEDQGPDLIDVNAFWLDYAEARDDRPFLSAHFAQAAGTFAEMMFALSVLDLPFESGQHLVEVAGPRLTVRAASPILLVREELLPARASEQASPVLLQEQYLRLDERVPGGDGALPPTVTAAGDEDESDDEDSDDDEAMADASIAPPLERVNLPQGAATEFLVGVPYATRTVLTNPTAAAIELDVLMQIPAGAVALLDGGATRGMRVAVAPFATATLECGFYFPSPGDFARYPTHVTRGGLSVAAESPARLHVVAAPTEVDTTSWAHVSQAGADAQVLAYLAAANLHQTDLTRIAWRMRDRAFFHSVLDRLRRRHVYDDVLWSYALLHEDAALAREYLRHAMAFLDQCGASLESPLLTLDPIERWWYQHVEFAPLVNARAHPLQGRAVIDDSRIAEQYAALLYVLAYRPQLDDVDWLCVTYYLLLQDRVEPALASFGRVDRARLPAAVQYDYMRAYLDFFSTDHAIARGIAEAYRDHPVARWRERFQEVIDQLDEAEGRVPAGLGGDGTATVRDRLAAEPALDLDIDAGTLRLSYQNLSRCEVRYHVMDVELLFSNSPFERLPAGSVGYVRPNRQEILDLPQDRDRLTLELPAELRNANVLVEVSASGITRSRTWYAHSLSVQTIEVAGQLKVSDAEGSPLAGVYVKVYAKSGRGETFHKDGYTDLRGRFDYAALSSARAAPERFAILVLSEQHGALIREVAAPPR